MTAIRDPQFQDVLKRAARAFDGIGKQPVRVSIATETAMVELVVRNVRNGDLRPATFLQHPPHLPEGGELKVLLSGTVAKDAQLRQDAHAWASVNRSEVASASISLRNAITAIRMADELLNDPDADEVLHEWKNEIATYLATVFACDTREAPLDRAELEAWCLTITNRANPCPEWLQDWRPGTRMFEPKKKPANLAEQFATHMTGGSDDD